MALKWLFRCLSSNNTIRQNIVCASWLMRSEISARPPCYPKFVMEMKKHEATFGFCQPNQVREIRALNDLIKFIPILCVGRQPSNWFCRHRTLNIMHNKQWVWCVALAFNYFWLLLNRNTATKIISQDIFLNLFCFPIKYTFREKIMD